MNEMIGLLLSLVAGLSLGALFFGGLWWATRRAMLSSQPVYWFLGSMLLRSSIVLAGFYFVAQGQWHRLIPCLLGFVAARILVVRLTKPRRELSAGPEEVPIHAP